MPCIKIIESCWLQTNDDGCGFSWPLEAAVVRCIFVIVQRQEKLGRTDLVTALHAILRIILHNDQNRLLR
jgi:hypothetical protein